MSLVLEQIQQEDEPRAARRDAFAEPASSRAAGASSFRQASKALFGKLNPFAADPLIENIDSSLQYQRAREEILSLPAGRRGQLLAELAGKSGLSGAHPVQTLFDFVSDLRRLDADERHCALPKIVHLIRTLRVDGVDLTREQIRAHDVLLGMALEMSPDHQRDALRALSQPWLPAASQRKAAHALDVLEAMDWDDFGRPLRSLAAA